VTVAVCAVAYAGSSAPWANVAFAVPSMPSTPAKPVVTVGPATTPDKLQLVCSPNSVDPTPTPDAYVVTFDGVEYPSQPASAGVLTKTFSPHVPGSSHLCTVVAWAWGGPSDPTTFSATLPKAPVSLSRPSVPLTGKTTRSIKVMGTVISGYAVGKASVVKLKFYRRQRSKSGKLYWSYKKTLTAKRLTPASTSYYLSTKLKPAGTWSVIAQTAATGSHVSATSARSRSTKIK
jgi:hypothetical protein